ncbi:hypothetical protein O3M35_000423 [Rhynocoris fuscipes]|uniref:Uncharacterized protein n=1 Tax=Rhynocoris fuscipes TaxID=488301 RepID=A0AAW1DQ43_9HEMI
MLRHCLRILNEFSMANGKNSGDGTGGDKGEASEGNSNLSLLILDRPSEFHKDVKKDIKDLKLNCKELCDNINSFKAEIKANFVTINEEFSSFKAKN